VPQVVLVEEYPVNTLLRLQIFLWSDKEHQGKVFQEALLIQQPVVDGVVVEVHQPQDPHHQHLLLLQ
jgi:hypothetical protein